MKYNYYICDVFTDKRFGGNQLAVLPQADGLTAAQMQQIAREFNFSESTFVFAPQKGQTRQVRIFTPTTEVPFAGHPNIGTAFVLAMSGELGTIEAEAEIVFEEQAGLVPITLRKAGNGTLWCELKAPEKISLGKTVSAETLSAAISLSPHDIVTTTHPPQVASVGLPFLIAELRNLDALQRARSNIAALEQVVAEGCPPDIHLYIHSHDDFDIRARMFAPFDGVPEDPATGSANCALAGMLAHYDDTDTKKFSWKIAQGVEMARPSLLQARATKQNGHVTDVWIGGHCVMVSEGTLFID